MGTTLLALLVHLDGSGAVTFLVTIPAMLPLYERLGMDKRVLACAASMAAGVNFLPWTGPMIRASAALKLPIPEMFNPLIAGPGRRPRLHLRGRVVAGPARRAAARADRRAGRRRRRARELTEAEKALRRPRNFWINAVADAGRDGHMVVIGDKIAAGDHVHGRNLPRAAHQLSRTSTCSGSGSTPTRTRR